MIPIPQRISIFLSFCSSPSLRPLFVCVLVFWPAVNRFRIQNPLSVWWTCEGSSYGDKLGVTPSSCRNELKQEVSDLLSQLEGRQPARAATKTQRPWHSHCSYEEGLWLKETHIIEMEIFYRKQMTKARIEYIIWSIQSWLVIEHISSRINRSTDEIAKSDFDWIVVKKFFYKISKHEEAFWY